MEIKQVLKNKWFIMGMSLIFLLILMQTSIWPISWNDAGYRTVIEKPGGGAMVQYDNGFYLHPPFSRKQVWPNYITTVYNSKEIESDYHKEDMVSIRFQDATSAKAQVIVRYELPSLQEDMIRLHKSYRTPSGLALKGLAPYTDQCIKSAAQLMDSEAHYSGGRSQLSEHFVNQLRNGEYIIDVKEIMETDSITNERKRIYINKIRKNAKGVALRVPSDIIPMGIKVATATIQDVDYAEIVDKKLSQKIEASTKESISKQRLITAQQEELTAAAEGRKSLVEIEYKEKQIQTQQVVQAQTKVELAIKDKERQRIAYEAAKYEALKIKELADAEAYQKRKVMQADNALDKKLEAMKIMNKDWAEAYATRKVPQTIFNTGGSQNSGGTDNETKAFMNMMMMGMAKDLSLDMKTK